MALEQLTDDRDLVQPEELAGPDHPMRKVTREVAFESGWSSGRARKIAELFDGLAEGWAATRGDPVRLAPVADGLRRGGFDLRGRWLELGSGTGAGTRILRQDAQRVTAVDLSAEMLTRAPAELAPRVRADACRLPFVDGLFDGVLLVNALLFPAEIDRVLAPDGRLLWVNTLGERTPIHLPAADVIEALPGSWSGVTARSGSGFWASIGRAD
ncbi:MAG: class I SAM-dependent methyltransferase [Acidimicrobiales bacterium]